MKPLRRISCSLASSVSAFQSSVSFYHSHGGQQQDSEKHEPSTTRPRPLEAKRRPRTPRSRHATLAVLDNHASPHEVSEVSRSSAPSRTVQAAGVETATPAPLLFDVYGPTLEKPLIPRHAGLSPSTTPFRPAADPSAAREEQVLEELTRKHGYDPATVIRLDKRTRQIHLNGIQKELVWSARRKEYQATLERIVTCLQSHRSPIEKCYTLLALHDEVIKRRLRLRTDTYEDIFHTFYAVAVQPKGATGHVPASAQASLTEGYALLEEDLHPGSAVSGSVPEELASTTAASQALLTPHFIGNLWQMYRYMVDSGTDPSPRVVQYVMGMLEHAVAQAAAARQGSGAATSTTTLLEAKAHSLMMDLDRFQLPPTEYTLNSYIGVCDGCGVMHLAVARVADFQARHERQASAGTYAKLLTGLVRRGQHREAMSVVSTMQSVPMTTFLLNAVLQAARCSPDPLSAFTFYRAAVRTQGSTGLQPSQVTFSILLEIVSSQLSLGIQISDGTTGSPHQATNTAARKSLGTNLDFMLREMRKHRVKGNGLFLNKLLSVLIVLGRDAEAKALRISMEAKGVRVFDELREKSPP